MLPAFELAAGVILVTLLGGAIVLYNGLVRLRNDCDKAWGNIDVLLRQRCDEIPNLVEVCRGYLAHERETVERVTQARATALAARTPAEAGHAALLADRALAGLFASVEAYPDLKASQPFLRLQHRLTGLESEIADRREFFNDCVNSWNTRIEQFPDLVIAGLMKARRRALLKLPVTGPVKVDLAA